MTRLLGLDIGGSKSRARLVTGSQGVTDAEAGSASLTAAGPAAAARALTALLAQLPEIGPASLDAICVGAAGLSAPATRQFLSARLAPLSRTGSVCIVSDAELAVPAAGLDDGIAVICGTGSVATGRWREHRVQTGGWGYLLGDEGSGYWIVRAAIRALLTRQDRGEPAGPLASRLLTAAGLADIDSLQAAFLSQPHPRRWAGYAPAVLDGDDATVTDLIASAASALATLAATAAQRLTASHGAPGDLPVVLAGGLMADARLRQAVLGALAAVMPGSAVLHLTEPPVAGAVRLAAECAVHVDR